jgi:hypothetical protein
MKMTLVATIFSLLVCACAAGVRESNTFYIALPSGVKRVDVTSDWLARLRTRWAAGTGQLSKKSALRPDDRQWSLDYIALQEEVVSECMELSLIAVERGDLGVAISDKNRQATIRPTKFNETWAVQSCGRNKAWRVYDDRGNLVVSPSA